MLQNFFFLLLCFCNAAPWIFCSSGFWGQGRWWIGFLEGSAFCNRELKLLGGWSSCKLSVHCRWPLKDAGLPSASPTKLASGDVSGKQEPSKGLTFYYQLQKGTFAIAPSLVFIFTPHSLTAALHLRQIVWPKQIIVDAWRTLQALRAFEGDFGSKIGH